VVARYRLPVIFADLSSFLTAPEKWDLITRGWKGSLDAQDSNTSNGKDFVKRVRLLVMDEVHLVGEDRGAVLEAIVSRTRYISRLLQEETSSATKDGKQSEITRLIGLSTPLENAYDLSDWIGIDTKSNSVQSGRGLFNFRNSVRPVPMRVHVQGFTGR
jgi:replicative superfamily II helicase